MPEQPKKVKIKTGLTIFSGLVILFVFIILIGTDDYLFSDTYNLYMYLDNTTGLVKGAPVTLGGYKIGDIQEVTFINQQSGGSIKIKLRILAEYKNRITASSYAEINSIGILGDKFVNISLGSRSEQPLPENSTIQFKESLNLENIAVKLTPGIDNLNNILKNISAITDTIAAGKGTAGQLLADSRIADEISGILKDINSITGQVRSKKGSLGKVIYDDNLYLSLQEASDNLNKISGDIKSGKGSIGRLIVNDSLYNNINSAGEKINTLLDNTGRDSTIINGLMKDKNLYRQLSETISNLNALIIDLKNNPEKYIDISVF
jgi:phospholipid/cholesterol/gamma-HCH transport system substrate-binding protein